ncbi:HlyD family secretion protein [Granulicella sp. L60]|uniref:HlyD family secretion protein n=1 Tax=Granulicella sp. L60 TaxID=1641866 RepID=UPI00131B655E|nr:HlyD family secretion protein [Granulicella sp. L60]
MPEQNGNENMNEKSSHDSEHPSENGTPPSPPDPKKRARGILIAVVVVLFLLAGCLVWWLHSRNYENTDDAQVDGHLNPIAARVGGTVTAVYAEDNQRVHAGQPLVDLDTKDAEIDLAQAQADYDQALAQLHAESPNVSITEVSNRSDLSTNDAEVLNARAALQAAEHDYDSDIAKLRQAEATNTKSLKDVERYKQLVDKQELAESDYDQYLSTAKSNSANVDATAAAVASQKKLIEQRQAQLLEQQAKQRQTLENNPKQVAIRKANTESRLASLKSYAAKLEQAKLNLSYCHVVAPVDGVVLQRSAELGNRVSAGGQLLMIAQVGDPWVVANFKETQVRRMHPGQSVDITVDALARTFHGYIEDMPAATGDRASVLPSENATGNYVKVIQRLPVRIHFQSGQADLDQLRAGMSVEPKVHLN